MAQSFYATISPAGYPQFPDLVIVTPLSGFSPGSPPARPQPGLPPYIDNTLPPYIDNTLPQPPLQIWGPPGPWPVPPIFLPDPLPPTLPSRPGFIIPPAGEPGSVTNPYPPGEVPPYAAAGLTKFYVVVPSVGVIGPYTSGPGTVPPQAP